MTTKAPQRSQAAESIKTQCMYEKYDDLPTDVRRARRVRNRIQLVAAQRQGGAVEFERDRFYRLVEQMHAMGRLPEDIAENLIGEKKESSSSQLLQSSSLTSSSHKGGHKAACDLSTARAIVERRRSDELFVSSTGIEHETPRSPAVVPLSTTQDDSSGTDDIADDVASSSLSSSSVRTAEKSLGASSSTDNKTPADESMEEGDINNNKPLRRRHKHLMRYYFDGINSDDNVERFLSNRSNTAGGGIDRTDEMSIRKALASSGHLMLTMKAMKVAHAHQKKGDPFRVQEGENSCSAKWTTEKPSWSKTGAASSGTDLDEVQPAQYLDEEEDRLNAVLRRCTERHHYRTSRCATKYGLSIYASERWRALGLLRPRRTQNFSCQSDSKYGADNGRMSTFSLSRRKRRGDDDDAAQSKFSFKNKLARHGVSAHHQEKCMYGGNQTQDGRMKTGGSSSRRRRRFVAPLLSSDDEKETDIGVFHYDKSRNRAAVHSVLTKRSQFCEASSASMEQHLVEPLVKGATNVIDDRSGADRETHFDEQDDAAQGETASLDDDDDDSSPTGQARFKEQARDEADAERFLSVLEQMKRIRQQQKMGRVGEPADLETNRLTGTFVESEVDDEEEEEGMLHSTLCVASQEYPETCGQENVAAVKIQSLHRGRQARTRRKNLAVDDLCVRSDMSDTARDLEMGVAAVTIQSAERGRQVRKKITTVAVGLREADKASNHNARICIRDSDDTTEEALSSEEAGGEERQDGGMRPVIRSSDRTKLKCAYLLHRRSLQQRDDEITRLKDALDKATMQQGIDQSLTENAINSIALRQQQYDMQKQRLITERCGALEGQRNSKGERRFSGTSSLGQSLGQSAHQQQWSESFLTNSKIFCRSTDRFGDAVARPRTPSVFATFGLGEVVDNIPVTPSTLRRSRFELRR